MRYETTARRLKAALDSKNMRPVDLARRAGMSEASVSQYVNGVNRPSKASAVKMAEILGVEADWLMGHDMEKAFYLGIIMREAGEIITDKPYLMNLLEAAKDLSKDEVDSIIVLIERLTK